MKRILLLRHGSAPPPNLELTDFERPLDEFGKKDIASIAWKLKELQLLPDIIISSTAKRAMTTADIIIKNLKTAAGIKGFQELYHADIHDYYRIISSQKNNLNNVMIVAHNPVISNFAEAITGKHYSLGPGNILVMDIDIQAWQDLPVSSPILNLIHLKP